MFACFHAFRRVAHCHVRSRRCGPLRGKRDGQGAPDFVVSRQLRFPWPGCREQFALYSNPSPLRQGQSSLLLPFFLFDTSPNLRCHDRHPPNTTPARRADRPLLSELDALRLYLHSENCSTQQHLGLGATTTLSGGSDTGFEDTAPVPAKRKRHLGTSCETPRIVPPSFRHGCAARRLRRVASSQPHDADQILDPNALCDEMLE